jgi:Fuc2NAc and GlcNAc transferase
MKYAIFIFFLNCLLSFIFIKFYLNLAKKIKIIDNQNPHYSNKPTVTGGGIIFIIIFLISNLLLYFTDLNFTGLIPYRYYILLFSVFILGFVCFKDDMKPIDPRLRLMIQIILIYLCLSTIKLSELNIPVKLMFLFGVIFWIYVMNIINFLDGSDGFLTVNVIFFWIGILIIKYFLNENLFSYYFAIINIPIAMTFLFFNKPKAELFMGDTGSIYNGILIGYAALELITSKLWFLAIVLLIYPLMDCTICLIKKIFKGYMPWVGLYDYFFLIPILRNKKNHKNVFFIIIIFNILNLIIVTTSLIFKNYAILLLSIFLTMATLLIYKKTKLEKISFFS